jgi:hypothetical protein
VSDPACGLVFRDTPSTAAESGELLSRRAQQLLWLLVVGLHVVLALLWQQATRFRTVAVDAALEVVWISVPRRPELVVPPMPAAPSRVAASQPAAPSMPPSSAAPASAASALDQGPAAVEDDAALFMPDGRLRLALPEASIGPWGDRERISRDRMPRLPGATDAAAAEKVAIRLRRAMTPEDVVLAVVRFLGGGARPDDCSKIEGRLHMSDEGVSREIDLNKFRRICTGVSIREAFDD